jgi:hypothetical protein
MILLEGMCNFEQEDLDFLLTIGGSEFPWYHGMATHNFPCLTHNLIMRTDKKEPGVLHSSYAPKAVEMFMRLCRKNNIVVRTIYRMAFNLTYADPSLHGDPHNDHPDFPHKSLLIYLNKFDKGETFLFDEKGEKITYTIQPAMDKFAVFEGCFHAQGFCRPQQCRQVFVATFDGDLL